MAGMVGGEIHVSVSIKAALTAIIQDILPTPVQQIGNSHTPLYKTAQTHNYPSVYESSAASVPASLSTYFCSGPTIACHTLGTSSGKVAPPSLATVVRASSAPRRCTSTALRSYVDRTRLASTDETINTARISSLLY